MMHIALAVHQLSGFASYQSRVHGPGDFEVFIKRDCGAGLAKKFFPVHTQHLAKRIVYREHAIFSVCDNHASDIVFKGKMKALFLASPSHCVISEDHYGPGPVLEAIRNDREVYWKSAPIFTPY